VTFYGTAEHRGIVIGGTHWTGPPPGVTQDVGSYEVVRALFNVVPPQLALPPSDFDRKVIATTPSWSPSNPSPPASFRQYWGPAGPRFGDYPRIHTLGILEPIGAGTAPRLFVSGFHAWGNRWAHDFAVDPGFGTVGGQGFEIGQMPSGGDDSVRYCTSLLLPGLPGGISNQVARIGGRRIPPSGPAYTSDRVETVMVNVTPPATSTWLSTGPGSIPHMNHPRHQGNVVLLPTGELFAIGGENLTGFNDTPELLVGGTTWVDMAPHLGARDYHSAAILLPDARVFVCGGEWRQVAPIPGVFTGPQPGPDYLIWEPPYFHLSDGRVPATGITVRNEATPSVIVQQNAIGGSQALQYGQTYRADWTNTLEPGISITSVVLMRPAALTHHDDGGQRMVRLNTWDDGTENSVVFQSPPSVLHAQEGWWMLFLVNSAGRPSQAYWVHLR
jgi:hypothetical protein